MSAAVRHGADARLTSRPACAHALALCLLTLPAAALAQTATAPSTSAIQAYDIPAGALTPALNRFAQQAGVALSFEPVLAQNRRTAGLRGSYGVAEGFAALLAGTGLEAVRADNGAWSLRPQPRADGATLLAPLRIAGEQPLTEDASAHAGQAHAVDRTQLDRFPVTSTSDIFRDIPGVTAVNARNGASFDLNIRGMQGDRIKVLVDGTQSTTNTSKSYGGEGNHNYVDPDLIGHFSVEKGPVTGPYGAGTGGGVVRLDTLTAADLITGDKDWGLRLRGGWANNGSDSRRYSELGKNYKTPGGNRSASAATAWRGLEDTLELVFAHSEREQANYQAGRRGSANKAAGLSDEQFNTSQNTRSTLLKAKTTLPRDQWMELGYSRLESEFGEMRIGTASDNQNPLSEVDKDTWTLRYGWSPTGSDFWSLRANLWQAEVTEAHPVLRMTSGLTPQEMLDRRTTTTRGSELWNRSLLSLWRTSTLLSYGGSLQREDTEGHGITEPAGERDLTGVFVQAQTTVTSWLTLDAGLRHETYTVQGDGVRFSPILGQNPIPFRLDDGASHLNFNVGASFTPWDPLTVYARYSEGWRPPTPKEAILSYAALGSLLKAETTRGTEVGSKLDLASLLAGNDTLSLKLAWFDNRHNDYLARNLGGPYSYNYYNIDAARFRGFEFNASYDAGFAFASYGVNHYSDVRFCGFSQPECTDRLVVSFGSHMWGITMPPKQTHTMTVGTRLLDRKLTLGLRGSVVSEGIGAVVDPNAGVQSHGWSAYDIYDFFGSYRAGAHLELGLSVENLRDHYYVEAMTSPAITIAAPGRTAKVTLTYKF